MTIMLELIGDAAAFDGAYRVAGNQRDNLCGCYWANLVCRVYAGCDEIDEERAAQLAGCVVPDGPTRPEFSLPWGGAHPDAQPTWPYRLPLPTSSDDDAVGTSPLGVVRAIEGLSSGRLVTVALRSSRWTEAQVVGLIRGLARLGSVAVTAIANVATRHLAAGRDQSVESMLAVLAGSRGLPSASDWDVGHFASLAGLATGEGGTFVVWRDTYKPMGERGYFLQSPAAVADALHRDGTGMGGVLVAVATDLAGEARELGESLELTESIWSNGSPEPGVAEPAATR